MLRTMAEKKSSPKPIRLPADLVEKLEKLSLFLFEEGIHASHSLSATVVMVLRQGDKYGLLDAPPSWYQPVDAKKKR